MPATAGELMRTSHRCMGAPRGAALADTSASFALDAGLSPVARSHAGESADCGASIKCLRWIESCSH